MARPAAPIRVLLVAVALAVVAGTVAQLAVPRPAAAAAGFRYWGFYQWKAGSWHFATKGPAAVVPKDGAVDGWRYAIAGKKTPPRLPRAAGSFDRICGSTPAKDGRKRVAVVLDYGLADEAPDGAEPPEPRGACAVVDPAASSAEALAAVAKTRLHKGFVCGLDGYPATGCSEPVKSAPKVPSPEPTVDLALSGSDGPGGGAGGWQPWTIAALVAVAVLLAAGAFVRRRRGQDH